MCAEVFLFLDTSGRQVRASLCTPLTMVAGSTRLVVHVASLTWWQVVRASLCTSLAWWQAVRASLSLFLSMVGR